MRPAGTHAVGDGRKRRIRQPRLPAQMIRCEGAVRWGSAHEVPQRGEQLLCQPGVLTLAS